MSKLKKDSLNPLQIIRTETALSKLPIHNLSKKKKINIQITKKNEEGKIELDWKVTPNNEYGQPGELAYKIDTLVINRRIDELGRPVPEKLSIGTQNEICGDLDLPATGKNRTNVKKALRQNAFAAISAKFDYKGRDGTQRRLEADFTRYSVVFTGERFSDGKKADAVHIIFNPPYREVLNNAPVRPLDYNYLKELLPAAQRFYEILSYRIFPAIKYQHKQAKLLYSECCTFSAQQRYYDYDHFKKQMYKIHKPHLASGYIEKVEYQETTDADGKPDWAMYYTPGPKAKAEYKAFNCKQLIESEVIDLGKPSAEPKQEVPKQKQEVPKQKQEVPKQKAPAEPQQVQQFAPSPALSLVQHFHKLARNLSNYRPSGKELAQAEALLAAHGTDKANFVVAFAVAEAKKTDFQMRTFGAVLQYVNEALDEYERRANIEARRRAQEAEERRQAEEIIAEQEARLKRLPQSHYSALYEQVKAQVLIDCPWLNTPGAETLLQSRIREEMIYQLDKQGRSFEL